MSTWDSQIEDDLEWREAEIGVLKLLLASAPDRSKHQAALLRACCAMIYAHYEGFCKFCWTLLLEAIEADSVLREELKEPIACRAMITVFKTLRGNPSDTNLWEFGASSFREELKQRASFSEGVNTKSNLWPAVAIEINASMGISCSQFHAHKAKLSQLVARRNSIAHGEKMEFSGSAELQEFQDVALLVMHDLAVEVVECLEHKGYLRAVPQT